MSISNRSSMESEVSVSELLAGQPLPHSELALGCYLLRTVLRDGIDVLVWQGTFPQPMSMNVRDDWGRVYFCYALQGRSHFSLSNGHRSREYVLKAGTSCISYTPDCHGRSTHAGHIESVTVSVRPDLLHDLIPNMDPPLIQHLGSARCYAPCRCAAEMGAIAYSLSGALRAIHLGGPGATQPSSLWLLGQSLVLISLAIEAHRQNDAQPLRLSPADKQKLLRARDRLLADLSHAPTIAELAKETGLGVLKLKRGFRELFQHSIYGLFQHERMHEAKRRLAPGDQSVMVVASDLGYANASHFAAAFQKQFGMKPSALKQRQ